MNFTNDIPTSVASAAHYGTSFVPEKRAQQERDDYAATLTADYEALSKHADTDEKRALLAEEFERYRAGYRQRTMRYLHSRSRLVSWMIAGPSNFPARRMEKRGEVSHKRLTELLDFRERAKAAILKKLHPEWRPIMAGDADAVERLEANIREAERLQEAMKQANAIIRQKPKYEVTPEKLADMITLGIRESIARKLFERDCCGRIGYADYQLTNNGANIRRMKQRLESISRAQATPDTVQERENARIEDCPSENRVRLFFPGKPNEEIRTKLKGNGFRWTPSLGCWQGYRNYRTMQLAKEIAGEVQP